VVILDGSHCGRATRIRCNVSDAEEDAGSAYPRLSTPSPRRRSDPNPVRDRHLADADRGLEAERVRQTSYRLGWAGYLKHFALLG